MPDYFTLEWRPSRSEFVIVQVVHDIPIAEAQEAARQLGSIGALGVDLAGYLESQQL